MRSRLFIISLFTILLFLFAGCRIGTEYRRSFIQAIPFEKAKWNSDDYEERAQFRSGMARNLIADKSLIGKSRIEIIEMLGENEDTYDAPIGESYAIADIWGWNIDPIAIEYLRIKFNSENKVEKAEIEFYKTGDW